MNGSTTSPDPASKPVGAADGSGDAPATANGHRSPATGEQISNPSPAHSIGEADKILPDAPAAEETEPHVTVNGADEDAASEAETLITSPVKRKEAEKRSTVIKIEKPQKSRIGGLPVPQDDDEDAESAASPMQSTEVGIEKGITLRDAATDEDAQMVDGDGSEHDDESDSLSSARSSPSELASQASSRDAALSETQDVGHEEAGELPLNPRKRKNRASSVGLPNSKRQSMEPPQHRRLRGMHSEDIAVRHTERSPSPKLRSHRRAVSTQSGLDGTIESGPRQRRGPSQFSLRDSKAVKTGWEESDASSETASRGQPEDTKRPQRGIGRSTSTPGRPGVAHHHKRYMNKYGFTRLAEACEMNDLDLVKQWREDDPDQLELAEFAGNTPLQIAALNGNAEITSYLIDQGCRIDCANVDKDTPLIDAAENGHLDVVKSLLDAGVDPLRQNLKGQQALDVITDENDEATDIRKALRDAIDRWNSSEAKQRREEEEEERHRAGASKELHLMSRTYENLLRLVQINDRHGIREFLDARVPVDNGIIAAAAKTGDLYLVNMLLVEMTEKKAHQKAEKPMLSVLGTSHFEMVKSLTELDQFSPTWRNRQGKSWPELAEERHGPMWRQEKELLQRLHDQHVAGNSKERRSSSPVTKRETNGKRSRFLHRHPDQHESDDEHTIVSKRKHKRKLMSRKDMRAAGGKGALSDSSEDEESTSDTAAPSAPASNEMDAEKPESTMRPPESPNTRRQAGRLRSKSISSQQSASEHVSPKSRRRSSSLRGVGVTEKPLPTVEEKAEERDAAQAADQVKKEMEEEAKFALEQAQALEAKRKEAEEAEAEAKRVEEEARKAEEGRLAEEEQQRKAEEERQATEARREEEARLAEEARKAEEERQQRERELEEARRKHTQEVLSALPNPLMHILDPESAFHFDRDAERNFLLSAFTPLQIVRISTPPFPSGQGEDYWVLNLQAAALLGKQGLQLFFQRGSPAFEGSLAERWRVEDLGDGERAVANQILADMPVDTSLEDRNDWDPEMPSFAAELSKAAQRYNAYVEARKRLHGGNALLRLVRLEDVRQHIHPFLSGSEIDIEFSPSSMRRDDAMAGKFHASAETGPIATGFPANPLSLGRESVGQYVSHTPVVVVHEK